MTETSTTAIATFLEVLVGAPAYAQDAVEGEVEQGVEGGPIAPEADIEAMVEPAAGEIEHDVAHADDHGAVELVLAAALIIVILVIAWKGRAAIIGMLDKRIERIRADLAEARALREEAEAALAEARARQQEASSRAEAIVTAAREEAERMRQKAAADLEAATARREAMAMGRIAQAEAQAIGEIRALAADAAVAAARSIIAERLEADPARRAAMVDAAIAALPQALSPEGGPTIN
jgi:F-type H+-transporting ATPase subunit b